MLVISFVKQIAVSKKKKSVARTERKDGGFFYVAIFVICSFKSSVE